MIPDGHVPPTEWDAWNTPARWAQAFDPPLSAYEASGEVVDTVYCDTLIKLNRAHIAAAIRRDMATNGGRTLNVHSIGVMFGDVDDPSLRHALDEDFPELAARVTLEVGLAAATQLRVVRP